MKAVFADTYFLLAAINKRERDHAAALRYFGDENFRFVTSAWVINEVAAALASVTTRAAFVKLYERLLADPAVEIVHASHETFTAGIELYSTRLDKEWSLTDCISFVVMKERQIDEALTGDKHFEQAGFTRLLG